MVLLNYKGVYLGEDIKLFHPSILPIEYPLLIPDFLQWPILHPAHLLLMPCPIGLQKTIQTQRTV